MNAAATITPMEPHPLSLTDKAAFVAACALSVAVYLTVGWLALAPEDPRGAVSLLACRAAPFAWLQVCVLAVVVAALTTALWGRRLSDLGLFAVAVGLAALTLKGANASYLLVAGAGAEDAPGRGLALKLALEALAWFLIPAISAFASLVTMRWCAGARACCEGPAPGMLPLGASDIPLVGEQLCGVPVLQRTAPMTGLKHTAVAAVAALVIMHLLAASLHASAIRHGQACFLLAASVILGTYIAFRVVPVRSALWPVLAVPLVALLSYLWAAVSGGVEGQFLAAPGAAALRVLPLQFIAVGVASAVAGTWLAGGTSEAVAAGVQRRARADAGTKKRR